MVSGRIIPFLIYKSQKAWYYTERTCINFLDKNAKSLCINYLLGMPKIIIIFNKIIAIFVKIF